MRNRHTSGIESYGRWNGGSAILCAYIDVPPSQARPGLFGD
jgi:hypothetical protein